MLFNKFYTSYFQESKKKNTCQCQDSNITVKVINLYRNKMSILGKFLNAIRSFYQNEER